MGEMSLSTLDWIIIIGFFLLIVGVGLSYTKKAGKSLENFFLGGRNLPWYIAGISMVATTFAADTPLAVTELVGKSGISGNWLWWSFLAGGMLTTFFFARLWRNSGVLTEVELSELRYSGTPAKILRGGKAIYLGIFMNVVIIGWVNVALMTLLEVFFGLGDVYWFGGMVKASLVLTAAAMLWTAIYSSMSGLLGVAITDVIQFAMAMIGTIILAVLVVNSDEIGGIAGMKEQLPEGSLNFFPSFSDGESVGKTLGLSIGAFLSYAAVQWWASWYPGAEPGGGGYIAQRMMSTRSARDSVYATLFFQIAHYCLRPWPWIIVGLCTIILYPELQGTADVKQGYVMAMRDFLPDGLKGLLLISFFAAYMSTISTQLNWGASYVVNDLYKRFIAPNADQKGLVFASRITTLLLMILGLVVSTFVDSISGAWGFIMQAGAGLGLVLILRWYWWRINAWSELSAMVAPFIPTAIFYSLGTEFEIAFPATVLFTTIVWIVVTFITRPTKDETLQHFYNKVRPDGAWSTYPDNYQMIVGGISENTAAPKNNLLYLILCWISAIIMTYGILFLIGKTILMEWETAGYLLAIVAVSFIALRYFISKTRVFAA
ncbi:MAG: SSS family solute:Na+ symporter [Maribacter sp.]|jgi:SSS family solute:Na+ symporter